MRKLLRLLIEQRLKRAEVEFDTSLSYFRKIARTSLPHFLMFMTITPASRFRKVLKAEPYHVARIATARHEGCGSCLQMEVALANKAGVGKALTRAAAEGNTHQLSPELAQVYAFSEAVLRRLDTEPKLRDAVLHLYGEEGLVELSMAISLCRTFPILKRAMGFTVPCIETRCAHSKQF